MYLINLFIEGVPLCIDFLQVILQLLGAGATGSCLDQTLAQRVDVLKLCLQWINVFLLESLKANQRDLKNCFYIVDSLIAPEALMIPQC